MMYNLFQRLTLATVCGMVSLESCRGKLGKWFSECSGAHLPVSACAGHVAPAPPYTIFAILGMFLNLYLPQSPHL